MATAVTQEILESDDQRYVANCHVHFPCEIKLIFHASLQNCLFCPVSFHHQWKGPGGVKESVHGDQLQGVYWKLQKQRFCNVSSVHEKVVFYTRPHIKLLVFITQ